MLGILLPGIAPGFAILSYFYLKDKYEPEPVSMVLNMFFSGALIIIPIAFSEYVLKVENIVQYDSIYAICDVSLYDVLMVVGIEKSTISRSFKLSSFPKEFHNQNRIKSKVWKEITPSY